MIQKGPESYPNVSAKRLIPIGRRPVVKGIAAGIAALAIDQFLPTASTSAQPLPPLLTEDALFLQKAYSGAPANFLDMKHFGDVEEKGEFVKITLRSSFFDRPHIVVAARGKEVLYTRKIAVDTFFAGNIKDFTRWNPDHTIDAPKYHRYQPANLYETQVSTTNPLGEKNPVFTNTIRKGTGQIMESNTFPTGTSLEEIAAILDHGGFPPFAPTPESQKPDLTNPIAFTPAPAKPETVRQREPRSAFTRSPEHVYEFFDFGPTDKSENQAVIWADPGVTLASELDSFDNSPFAPSKKEGLGDGRIRYSYPSPNPDRDNVIITKDGVVESKRRLVGKDTKQNDLLAILRQGGSPDDLLEYYPRYYGESSARHSIVTMFHSKTLDRTLGRVVIDSRSSVDTVEIQSLPSGGTVDQYKMLIRQMDAEAIVASPADTLPTSPLPNTRLLILLAGMDSTSYTAQEAFAKIVPAVSSAYDNIAIFGYLGGELLKDPTNPDALPTWLTYPFGKKDTYTDILNKPKLLIQMTSNLKDYYGQIDWLGHSQGAFIEMMAAKELITTNSPLLRYIRKIICLDGPVNGTTRGLATLWLQAFGDNTFGNENAQFIAALARTPEQQKQTRETNMRIADAAKKKGIEIFTLTNKGDLIVDRDSAIIPGHGKDVDLGLGDSFGHGEILTSDIAISEITQRLTG